MMQKKPDDIDRFAIPVSEQSPHNPEGVRFKSPRTTSLIAISANDVDWITGAYHLFDLIEIRARNNSLKTFYIWSRNTTIRPIDE